MKNDLIAYCGKFVEILSLSAEPSSYKWRFLIKENSKKHCAVVDCCTIHVSLIGKSNAPSLKPIEHICAGNPRCF